MWDRDSHMGRYLINAFFDLEEEKERRNFWLYLFLYGFSLMTGLLLDLALKLENGPGPLEQHISTDDSRWALCSSDSFLSDAFKRDAHCCLEGEGRPPHYPGLYPRGAGLGCQDPCGCLLWKWHRSHRAQACPLLASPLLGLEIALECDFLRLRLSVTNHRGNA